MRLYVALVDRVTHRLGGGIDRVRRHRGASGCEPHQRSCQNQSRGHRDPARLHDVTLIDSSFSWRGSTSDGAPLIGSTAFCVLGKAITSRSESVPQSIMQIRSTPNAIPPWGGAPYLSASSKKPKRSIASSRVKPNNSNTFNCSSRLWIRIEPPPSSWPLSTMS